MHQTVEEALAHHGAPPICNTVHGDGNGPGSGKGAIRACEAEFPARKLTVASAVLKRPFCPLGHVRHAQLAQKRRDDGFVVTLMSATNEVDAAMTGTLMPLATERAVSCLRPGLAVQPAPAAGGGRAIRLWYTASAASKALARSSGGQVSFSSRSAS